MTLAQEPDLLKPSTPGVQSLRPARSAIAAVGAASWVKDTAARRVRPWTLKGYESVIQVHIKPALSMTRLDRLASQQIQALINRKLDDGLAPKTVLSILALLRNSLRQAEQWGLVSRNVAGLVDPSSHGTVSL